MRLFQLMKIYSFLLCLLLSPFSSALIGKLFLKALLNGDIKACFLYSNFINPNKTYKHGNFQTTIAGQILVDLVSGISALEQADELELLLTLLPRVNVDAFHRIYLGRAGESYLIWNMLPLVRPEGELSATLIEQIYLNLLQGEEDIEKLRVVRRYFRQERNKPQARMQLAHIAQMLKLLNGRIKALRPIKRN